MRAGWLGRAVLLATILAACAPAADQAWQHEREETFNRWCKVISAPAGELAAAFTECQDRIREVDRRYGRWNRFRDTVYSYAIAAYRRVDRGELTRAEAASFVEQFQAYMSVETRRLGVHAGLGSIDAEEAFWDRIVNSFQPKYPSYPPPIRKLQIVCRTQIQRGLPYTTCQ
jgi:hypothetical protein